MRKRKVNARSVKKDLRVKVVPRSLGGLSSHGKVDCIYVYK